MRSMTRNSITLNRVRHCAECEDDAARADVTMHDRYIDIPWSGALCHDNSRDVTHSFGYN